MTESSRSARLLVSAALVVWAGVGAGAQTRAEPRDELAPRSVSLANLNAFRATSANWTVSGGAMASRIGPSALAPMPGVGVLLNRPAPGATAPLFTTWEHGDIDLSFDVMLPRGSRAGVYLMGRYEVLLSDSWGGRRPALTDIGALSPRWDATRGAGREAVGGAPPRLNASRAPGLWQHVDISFRAPRFDGHRKVANARFAKVAVNGVVVHENVEVAGYTRDAAFEDERPNGPLMLPGDRGALAVRNVRYKVFTGQVSISSLHYRAFEGTTMDSAFAATHTPVREGVATAFAPDPAGTPDKFALSYDGTITVPTTGLYRFQLDLIWIGRDSATRGAAVGGGRLTIDGKPALLHTGAERVAAGDVELTAGPHPFVLEYYKNRPGFVWRDVQVWVEGPGVERKALHDEFAATVFGLPPSPIVVDPIVEPVVLRSFLRHGGTKHVIVASVADPLGVHYSYDLARGALLYAWRGPFLETTQMWHERGEDQLAEPRGDALSLAGTPALAFLAGPNAPWPDSLDDKAYRREGYALDKTGHPTFLAHVGGIAVEDNIRPAADGLTLRRELHLRAPAGGVTGGLYLQLARGEHIVRQGDGSYVVGDRSYYITLPTGRAAPTIRRQNGHDELLLSVTFARGDASVAYNIVW